MLYKIKSFLFAAQIKKYFIHTYYWKYTVKQDNKIKQKVSQQYYNDRDIEINIEIETMNGN